MKALTHLRMSTVLSGNDNEISLDIVLYAVGRVVCVEGNMLVWPWLVYFNTTSVVQKYEIILIHDIDYFYQDFLETPAQITRSAI